MPKYRMPYSVERTLKTEPNCRNIMGIITGIMCAPWFVNVSLEDKKTFLDYMQEIERHNLYLRWQRVEEINAFLQNLNNKYNNKYNKK